LLDGHVKKSIADFGRLLCMAGNELSI